MKEVPLSGKYSFLNLIVDDVDFDQVEAFSWHHFASKWNTYARRKVLAEGEKQRFQFLHSYLTGWKLVDHINGNGLDNRRANLRPATQAENMRNREKQRFVRGDVRPTSRYKGVSLRRTSGRWYAYINGGGKARYLGSFVDETDAARAYDRAALEEYGEFALLNFPEGRQ